MLKISNYVRVDSDKEKIPIYVRVTNGRVFDLRARTKETCFSNQWDAENKKLKEKFLVEEKGKLVEKRDALTRAMILESRNTNSRLLDLEKKIEIAFKENEGCKIDTEWLKNIIDPPVIEENTIPNDFVKYCDFFIAQRGQNITKRYVEKIEAIKKIIIEYLKQQNKKVLRFEDINLQFGVDFENTVIDDVPFSKNYIERNIAFIKTIAYHAELNGITLNPQIKKLKVKGEKTTFQILSFDELEAIENTNFEDEKLKNVKDWLIISAFSGQRVSDFMRFDKSMITNIPDQNGNDRYFLDFVQEKTNHILHLPIHPKIINILERRNFEFPPKLCEQKYNALIKIVCKEAGIDEVCYGGISNGKRKVFGEYKKYELISSHVGRRSFASNFYGKIPTPLLMSATARATEKMFLKYIGKIDDQKSNALANYFYD